MDVTLLRHPLAARVYFGAVVAIFRLNMLAEARNHTRIALGLRNEPLTYTLKRDPFQDDFNVKLPSLPTQVYYTKLA